MNRRQYLLAAAAAAVAGCSSGGEPQPVGTSAEPDGTSESTAGGGGGSADGPSTTETTEASAETTETPETTEQSTPESAAADVGSLVEGDNVHLVVEGVERGADLGEFTDPGSGNEFLRVDLAMKNVSDDYLAVSNLLQTRVRDGEGYQYEQSVAGAAAGQSFQDGQFAPGEVERGALVFEVPTDATGLELVFDFEVSIFGGLRRAVVDLQSEASSVHELQQDLRVDVYEPGQPVSYGDVEVTVEEFRTEGQLDQFTTPEDGNEYVVADVAITNDTGEQQRFSSLLRMMLKDGDGYTYQVDAGALAALQRAFDGSTPLSDGETRRGELAYQVPEGTAPLYWVFEFDLFATGNRTFWQLR